MSAISRIQTSRKSNTSTDYESIAVTELRKRLTKREMLKYENMGVFARFKYDENYSAFRVHIWDIFD